MSHIQKQPLPQDRLRELGVGILYLFGSQAEGLAGASSDIDIGVVFSDPSIARGNTTALYNTLYDICCESFDMSGFKVVDIVFLERASLELRFDVITHGTPLFEVSEDFRLAFEERIAMLYRDFQPILKEFDRAILERI